MSGQTYIPETDDSGRTPVHVYWRDIDGDQLVLEDGTDTQTWTFPLAVDWVQNDAQAEFDAAMLFVVNDQSDDLLQPHVDNWEEVWQSGDIDVGGNLALDKVVKGSFYYLYSSLPSHHSNLPNNQFYGLSPGGLANGVNGSDYYGHVFWDMETWMYPAVLMFRPDLAKDMLSYRIHGMEPAFRRAYNGGFSGQ